MYIKIDDTNFKHDFKIEDLNFPIDTDDILGRDFLDKYNLKTDYETYTLSIFTSEKYFTIFVKSGIPITKKVPPRSEGIYPI